MGCLALGTQERGGVRLCDHDASTQVRFREEIQHGSDMIKDTILCFQPQLSVSTSGDPVEPSLEYRKCKSSKDEIDETGECSPAVRRNSQRLNTNL